MINSIEFNFNREKTESALYEQYKKAVSLLAKKE